jgi:Leucine-rich repeat (LRR) protein
MVIENKVANTTIKIPPSISRFQSLETLMLDNIIDSLPDEVSYCKSLNFLSLPNNQGLKKLPESIGTMDNLSFVNISGCDPSLRIPDSIADKFDDIGNGLYFKKD